MKLIPKYNIGGKPWYELLRPKKSTDYVTTYDTSTLVNPKDYGEAWKSLDIGYGTGRYKPITTFDRLDVASIEASDYYKNFTNALFDEKGNLTNVGLAYAKLTDTLLPEDSPARIYDKNGIVRQSWKVDNKDTYGRVPHKEYTNLKDYIAYLRGDLLAGSRHNIFKKKGVRYYYIDEKGNKTYVEAPIGGSTVYNISDTPIIILDENTTWEDYEITGRKENGSLGSLYPTILGDSLPQETIDKVNTNSSIDPNVVKERTPSKLKELLNTKMSPMLTSAARVAIDNTYSKKVTDEYVSHLRPPLQSPWEAYRMVHGDYIAKQNAEQQAARLRSAASLPFTSDADRQMAYQLEAIDKGNQAILAGQLRDALEFYRTSEAATNLSIQNIQNRTTVANTNRELLSKYDEARAKIIADRKLKNALNWDEWARTWEDRALAEHDDNYKDLRDRQKAFEESIINYGIDDSKVKAALKALENTYNYLILSDDEVTKLNAFIADTTNSLDDINAAKLKLDLHNLKKKAIEDIQRELKALQIAKIKAYGNYIGYDWNRLSDLQKATLGILKKNGGILHKFQQGGGFPGVTWTPLMGSPYQQYLALLRSGNDGSTSSRSSRSSSRSSSSDSDKEESSLIKSMIETLKGGDLLPADMDIISNQLRKFFDLLRYSMDGISVDSIYRGYIDMLSYVNRAKFSANTLKEAKTHLDSNKSLNSYAVSLDGEVWVGKVGTLEIGKVNPNQALSILKGETKGYRVLTNSDLLEVRSKVPKHAFNDDLITTSATSATSMELISKYVKDFVGKLGTDKYNKDFLTKNFGDDALQGMEVLNNLKNRNFNQQELSQIVLSLTGTGDIRSLIESKIMTESLASLAKAALSALSSSLPTNMKVLLYLLGGGELQASQLLTNMVLSNTSSLFSFGINDITPFNPDGTLGSSSKTGKGSEKGAEDKYKMSTTALWISGIGEKITFNINPDTKGDTAWQVTGNTMPLTNSEDKSITGAFTLQDISGNGALDLQHAYMGNTKITLLGLGKILLTDPNITRVALPITVDNLGGIKPDFERLKKVSEINKYLKKKNIPIDYEFDHTPTQKEVDSIIKPINKAYTDKLLPPKYNEKTGKINFGNYKYFGLIHGYSPDSALDQNNEFDRDLLKTLSDDERSTFEANIKQLNKDFKFNNGWFSSEDVYEGVIFIPIRDNVFNSLAGKGSTYAPENPNAMNAIDAILQKSDAIRALGGIHPIIRSNF